MGRVARQQPVGTAAKQISLFLLCPSHLWMPHLVLRHSMQTRTRRDDPRLCGDSSNIPIHLVLLSQARGSSFKVPLLLSCKPQRWSLATSFCIRKADLGRELGWWLTNSLCDQMIQIGLRMTKLWATSIPLISAKTAIAETGLAKTHCTFGHPPLFGAAVAFPKCWLAARRRPWYASRYFGCRNSQSPRTTRRAPLLALLLLVDLISSTFQTTPFGLVMVLSPCPSTT